MRLWRESWSVVKDCLALLNFCVAGDEAGGAGSDPVA